jgi:Leucine-rich repeat (LRR) protein
VRPAESKGAQLTNRDGNRLSYLSGLPSSILNLHASHNKLSSLTSVAHLRRIEILDVSNNQLDSVFRMPTSSRLLRPRADKQNSPV